MKYLITCISFFTAISCFSQHNNELYNNGALIYLNTGAEVHVLGDSHMTGSTGTLENNGLVKVQGNSYSDNLFQQRGTGTYRIENSDVNIGERQFIQGSYAVRGGQAQTNVDDGGFYTLELANDQGVVYLVGTGNVADAKNSVDFQAGTILNTIITHDIGLTGAITYPANGSNYDAVFGLMNNAPGLGNLINNTITTNGNMSAIDAGYVIGKFRRSIDPAGGQYGYILGVEPAGPGAQRGVQYNMMDFQANNYDVITGYFESGSPNNSATVIECSGNTINYWGGVDHGEWMFDDITGSGSGTYEMTVWPQDDNFIVASIWVITKDDLIQGTANQCGPSPVGLSRGGFSGFSEFDVAAAITALPVDFVDISAVGVVDHIEVDWNVASESNLSHYELFRSEDGVIFDHIADITNVGNTNTPQSYHYDDYDVRYFQNYYYQVKSVDMDGNSEYTPVVVASISKEMDQFTDEAVTIYPNPTMQDFMVSIISNKGRDLVLDVYNSLGQLVATQDKIISEGNTVITFGTTEWAPGVYYIELTDKQSKETINKRIIKQ